MSEKKKIEKLCMFEDPNWEPSAFNSYCMCSKHYNMRKKEKREILERLKILLKEPEENEEELKCHLGISNFKCYVIFNFSFGRERVFINLKSAKHLVRFHGLKLEIPKRISNRKQDILDILSKIEEFSFTDSNSKLGFDPLIDLMIEEEYQETLIFKEILRLKEKENIFWHHIEPLRKRIKNQGY
jgi:hypothetical protein